MPRDDVAVDAPQTRSRTPLALVTLAGILAIACLAEVTGNDRYYLLTAGLFVFGLALGWRYWLRRASGRIAVFLAIVAAIITVTAGLQPLVVINAGARMSGVLVLMLSISLLRPVFAERRLDQALAALLARVTPALRPLAVLLSACLASLGLSFGTVAVFGATLGGRAAPEHVAPQATMRGLVLSMLLGPSTSSVAAVMATYPSVSWGTSLSIGVPLAAAGLAVGALGRQTLAIAGDQRSCDGAWTAFGILLGELVTAVLAHEVLAVSMTLAIALASASIAIACAIYWGRDDLGHALRRTDSRIVDSWRLVMPETALFLSCGLVVGVMQAPGFAAPLKALAAAALPSGMWGIASVLVAMPLITVAGIHPMVPFAVLSPVVSAANLGINVVGLYAMWIMAFMLSMLLSPVSVLTLVTTANFGVPQQVLGLRGHGLYAAALAVVSAGLIAFLCRA